MKDTTNSGAQKNGVRETSFGKAPTSTTLNKGSKMHKFGHDIRNGEVWPKATDAVNQKTGFPKGADGK